MWYVHPTDINETELKVLLLFLFRLCLYFSWYVDLCIILQKDFLHITEDRCNHGKLQNYGFSFSSHRKT